MRNYVLWLALTRVFDSIYAHASIGNATGPSPQRRTPFPCRVAPSASTGQCALPVALTSGCFAGRLVRDSPKEIDGRPHAIAEKGKTKSVMGKHRCGDVKEARRRRCRHPPWGRRRQALWCITKVRHARNVCAAVFTACVVRSSAHAQGFQCCSHRSNGAFRGPRQRRTDLGCNAAQCVKGSLHRSGVGFHEHGIVQWQ